MLVLGAPNSSNSLRLAEVAERTGIRAQLIERAEELELGWLEGVQVLGVTAGASAPEILVRELIDRLKAHFVTTSEEVEVTSEDMLFKLPRILAAA